MCLAFSLPRCAGWYKLGHWLNFLMPLIEPIALESVTLSL
ncbi:hypothetical protein CFBP7900_10580 [Xanthomonas hortorum pv. carotae]|uniref:Uncharacterized protein n=1 Tax=Xanthomonas hortorum pv. carotae TaxID=487904 RepID=A0A6V7CHG7_9XANT|nr:hypothetical protein CFBP7900_10580 [Xanthomonas hortorum pv. carotae]CAD0315834.1 hypothetical protein CFBP7900_10580 [Xanthomonas hortorum pv. carotae]